MKRLEARNPLPISRAAGLSSITPQYRKRPNTATPSLYAAAGCRATQRAGHQSQRRQLYHQLLVADRKRVKRSPVVLVHGPVGAERTTRGNLQSHLVCTVYPTQLKFCSFGNAHGRKQIVQLFRTSTEILKT